MKLASRTYQLIQLLGAIFSIGMGVFAVRSFVIDYENWLGFLLIFLALCLVSMVFYIQARRRGGVTVRGKEHGSYAPCQHKVYYPQPFKHVPHLSIYSLRVSMGGGLTKYAQCVSNPSYRILRQCPEYFAIEVQSHGAPWRFKWKAQGHLAEQHRRPGIE